MSTIASAQPHTPLSPAGSPQPAAPGSPSQPGQDGVAPSGGPVRRKASRRANTAERRATHNAVERQRRETLNSRFLDLAALLPNLASVRRPSKSAIVNSSIVLIHAQRRARAVAGRELRTLKAETDILRRELNDWRDRASMPRVEEGPRSADFAALLALEEEEEMGEDERRAYELRDAPDGDDGDDDFPEEQLAPPQPHHHHHHHVQQQHHLMQQQAQPAHFHAVPSQMHHAAVLLHQHQQAQRMAIHTAFDQPHPSAGPLYDAPLSAISMHSGSDVYPYAPPQQMFTPPGSSHGPPPQPPAIHTSAPQSFMRPQPQQQYFPLSGSPSARSGSDAGDDASSASSGSPPHLAAPFDLPVPVQLAAGMGPREMATSFGWPAAAAQFKVPAGGPFGMIM